MQKCTRCKEDVSVCLYHADYNGSCLKPDANIDPREAELAALREEVLNANACLDMVRDWLSKYPEYVDIDATPAMLYADACNAVRYKSISALREVNERLIKLVEEKFSELADEDRAHLWNAANWVKNR